MNAVFFYGLFMDADLLVARGLGPRRPRKARIEGYGLRIRERATLVPREGLYFAAVGNFVSAGLNVRDVAVTNVLTVNAATAG